MLIQPSAWSLPRDSGIKPERSVMSARKVSRFLISPFALMSKPLPWRNSLLTIRLFSTRLAVTSPLRGLPRRVLSRIFPLTSPSGFPSSGQAIFPEISKLIMPCHSGVTAAGFSFLACMSAYKDSPSSHELSTLPFSDPRSQTPSFTRNRTPPWSPFNDPESSPERHASPEFDRLKVPA